MSRYNAMHKKDPEVEVFYGWDHALGYWCDVADYVEGKEEFEFIIKEKSSITGDGRGDIIDILKRFNVPEDHIMKIAMDLTF